MATSLTVGGPPVTGTADNQFFYEDEVFRFDKKGRVKFGLVLENSEAFSSDDEDDLDMVLSKGEIRVAWHPNGDEETLQERAVCLADRTLMPGDVVRRLVPGKDTQRGYCREISMRADVRIVGTKYVVKNVVGERLRPIQQIPRDNAVCLDSWVGSTKCINEKVVLMSSCGALIEVPDGELLQLKDVNTKYRNGLFSETVFYPGQVVTGRLESLDNVKLLTPTGLKTNKKGKLLSRKFVVKSVQVEGIWVHWQCKALSEDCVDLKCGVLQQPKPYVTGEDLKRLKRLNLFESCMLQINDKNYLKISDCDVMIRKSQWEKEQAIKYKIIVSQQQKEESNVSKPTSTNSSSTTTTTTTTTTTKPEKIKIKFLSTSVMEPEKKAKSQHLIGTLRMNHNYNNIERLFPKERHETETKHVEKSDSKMKSETNATDALSKKEGSDDWQTDEDELDEDEDDSMTDSATNVSSCSSPTPKSSPKHRPLMQKKHVKKLKKTSSTGNNDKPPAVGDEVVTEALVVYSTATVVWQDGTIESGIPSTQLYPIHHLDDHEYFPGDFVLSNVEGPDLSYRDYGVIHSVDHQGRTAKVRWFTTYTSAEDPKPTYKGETEVSVYDLKDHPDFQYRPGTIVIRVANFIGEDATCTAGQIVDNYADGRVKVWWVDGHIGMCWPQDLFEVGQYDADNNFSGNNESDDSWETESEISEPGGSPPKAVSEPHLSENLERARIAVARLEEIFIINPNLQNHEVMRKLLAVYKKCRYLDRLMNTSFFHEDHFMGLLEPVRKGGTQTKSERAQDQKNRLFNQAAPNVKVTTPTTVHANPINSIIVEANTRNELSIVSTPDEYSTPNKEFNQSVILNITSSPLKFSGKKKSFNLDVCPLKNNPQQQQQHQQISNASSVMDGQVNSDAKILRQNSDSENVNVTSSHLSMNSFEKKLTNVINNAEKMNDDAGTQTRDKTQYLKVTSKSQDDSGNYSRNDCCDCCSTSYESTSDLTNDVNNSLLKATDDQKSVSCSSIEFTEDTPDYVCAHLCALLKAQLVKALQEIQDKYCQSNLNISEIVEAIEDEEVVQGSEKLIRMPSEEDGGRSVEDDTVEESEKSNAVPEEVDMPALDPEAFQILETAPSSHKFHLTIFHPANQTQYYKAVRREHKVLKTSLPPGVWVRGFEDRMDLLSVMIEGPKNTPYEDGLFFFDMQMGRDYPSVPPLCHYISYCSDRLNPNLYEDGKVCVSLLGTWSGRDTEVWSPVSTILQVIVSIQGLILVPEPYFNEAGFDKQKGTQQGKENSRMYNEMAILKLVQSMTKLVTSPPELFRAQIIEHFKSRGKAFYSRIKRWMEYSQLLISPVTDKPQSIDTSTVALPEFPLVPASRGFCLTLSGLLDTFNRKLEAIIE